jgi:hypothetical protein
VSRLRILLATLLVGTMLTLTAGSAVAAPATGSITTPVTGTVAGVGTFAGDLTINSFRRVGDTINAVGTLTGTLTSTAGAVLGTVTNLPVSIPITQAAGSCSILHLELGPLDLDLLGLRVHLDKVVLDISAQPGSGNLLGNLLCAIAGLLDNAGGPLGGITALLNRLLGALGNITL